MSEPIHVATVIAAWGNRGEVKVYCPSGHPERLLGLKSVLVKDKAGTLERRQLSRARVHKNRLLLHFSQVDSIDAADSLVGSDLYLPETELPKLPEGTYYTYRLLGARVADAGGRSLGRVVDTEESPGQDLLVVEKPDGERVLVPMTAAIVQHIDLAAATVIIDPPDGLLSGEPEVAMETE